MIGALWLDSEKIASFKAKELELIMTRDRFSRLLSPNVAEQVISGKLDIKKGRIRVPVATVFVVTSARGR